MIATGPKTVIFRAMKPKRSMASRKLERWMKDNEVDRLAVAKGMGCTIGYVGMWLRDEAPPGRKMATRLQDFTDGTVEIEMWER